MKRDRPAATAERTDPTNPAEAPILARQMAAYVQALDLAVGRTVAEVGCGRGAGTGLLAEVARKVTAIDYDAACIEQNRAEQDNEVVTFVLAEVPPIPPAALRVDMVVCFQMIEHLQDPQPLLKALYEAVLPGGVVVISTPNAEESLSANPYHLHEYTGPELQTVLESIYDRVSLFSVLGDDVFERYWLANKARVQRVLRWDPLGVNRYLPARLKRRLYDLASRRMRRQLQEDSRARASEITPDNFRFEPGLLPGALDFYAVCVREQA